MKKTLKNHWEEFRLLMNNIPAIVLSLFVVSVVLMNLLANKELDLRFLVTDCGITISWLAFLVMDMLTKHYGPKAAIYISLFAEFINLCTCFLFFLISLIPANWAMFYDLGDVANITLNATIGGTWYVLFGSTIAFVASAIINAVLNWFIGTFCKKDNFINYAIRSYISTAVGQFSDNFIFALIVSHTFFGWTISQCVIAAITTGVVELVCEVIFGPVGYKVVNSWKTNQVGKEYFDYVDVTNS